MEGEREEEEAGVWPVAGVVELEDMERMDGGKVSGRRLRVWLALGLLVNPVTFFIAFRFTYYPPITVGESMAPTHQGTMVAFADRVTLWFSGPERGDVVGLDYPLRPGQQIGKRVIGLPGDRLMIVRGVVFIDGQRLEEPYVSIPYDRTWDNVAEFTLGPGEYWVMGDNRGNSTDSRDFGPVDESAFIAVQTNAVIWPISMVTPSGVLATGAIVTLVVTASVLFGRAAARQGVTPETARTARKRGRFLWALGYWLTVREGAEADANPNGEVWRVPRPLRQLPPPPEPDETPIPTEEPVGVVIVGPRLGVAHFLLVSFTLGSAFYGYVYGYIPGELGTVLGALALTWFGWFDAGAPRARNIGESLAMGVACGLVGLALRSQFGGIGTVVFIAATVGLAVVLWRGRAQRTGRRFAALEATPGATLRGFELSTRELRPGDLDRSA